MMRMRFLGALLVLGMLHVAGVGHAASTAVGVGAAVGDDSSMAYSINVRQTYEPWVSGTVGELKPFAELSGHLWTKDDTDTVWGASLAPGLMFTLATSSVFQPYLAASVGGTAISDDKFGSRDLGSHLLFRTKGVLGVQFGDELRHSLQGEYTYFSNWGFSDTNDGFSTYGLSYAYSF